MSALGGLARAHGSHAGGTALARLDVAWTSAFGYWLTRRASRTGAGSASWCPLAVLSLAEAVERAREQLVDLVRIDDQAHFVLGSSAMPGSS